MAKMVKMLWDKGTAGDMSKGDMGQTIQGQPVHVGGLPFSMQIDQGGAASPQGTYLFETSNNGSTWVTLDPTLMLPGVVEPDGTATARKQTLHSSVDVVVEYVRLKYTRTAGGAADTLEVWINRR